MKMERKRVKRMKESLECERAAAAIVGILGKSELCESKKWERLRVCWGFFE